MKDEFAEHMGRWAERLLREPWYVRLSWLALACHLIAWALFGYVIWRFLHS
jgi:hypothetical protein